MKTRMAIATLALALAPFTLGACSLPGSNSADSTPPPPATASSSTPTTPTTTAPTFSSAKDLIGDWESGPAQWVVHFKSDGTYVEDFQGNVNFRTGTYEVAGTEVSLIGGDGETDKGRIAGESLVFRLGTLTRK